MICRHICILLLHQITQLKTLKTRRKPTYTIFLKLNLQSSKNKAIIRHSVYGGVLFPDFKTFVQEYVEGISTVMDDRGVELLKEPCHVHFPS